MKVYTKLFCGFRICIFKGEWVVMRMWQNPAMAVLCSFSRLIFIFYLKIPKHRHILFCHTFNTVKWNFAFLPVVKPLGSS